MSLDQYHHGVRVVEITGGSRPIRTVSTAIIGLIATASDADAATFPINTPVLVTNVYDALAQPVWVAHGARGDFTDYRGLAAFAGKPNWQVSPLQTGALPHFEPASGYLEAFSRWLAEGVRAPPRP